MQLTKDQKFIGSIVLVFIAAAFVTRLILDWWDTRQNMTNASNSTAGTVVFC